MKRTESPKKSEQERKANTESQSSPTDDEFEDAIMVAYQKKEPGEWEKIEISYKRKKVK